MVVYITNPGNISPSDIGHMKAIGITVFTANTQYYVECNAKSAHRA